MNLHQPELRFAWKFPISDFFGMIPAKRCQRSLRDSAAAPANPPVPLPAPDVGFCYIQHVRQIFCLEAAEKVSRFPKSAESGQDGPDCPPKPASDDLFGLMSEG